MYHKGQGVKQDYFEAVKWYQKAAEQGDGTAQRNLGIMFYFGRGVRQDKYQAREWFGKACDNSVQAGCDDYVKLNRELYN